MITKVGFIRMYACDVCRKREEWGPSWGVYGSVLLNEMAPDAEIHCCSEGCMEKAVSNIESGKWRLPEYSMNGYSIKQKGKGRGYGKFKMAAA